MNLELTNPDLLYPLLGAVIALLGLALIVYGISIWTNRGKTLAARLDQFVAAGGKVCEAVKKKKPYSFHSQECL